MGGLASVQVLYILVAARWTIVLSIGALVSGSLLGALLTLLGLSRRIAVQRITTGIEQVVQGTPLLVLLLLAYFGSSAVGIELGALLSSILALGIYAGAFLGTIWRAAILAVPPGQSEAAAALGLSRMKRAALVILPQALRVGLAPTCGFTVQMIKNTSLASIVGYVELTRAGQIVSNVSFHPLASFGVVAAIYFVLCLPFTLLTEWLEERQARLSPL